jgi:hypothetical protein
MWIQGNQFKKLTKWHYAPARIYTGNKYRDDLNNLPFGDYRYLMNTLDVSKLQDGDIIYTHGFYAEQLFEKPIKQRYVLVTHNADTNIEIAPPENVIRWFAQNVNIVHPRIQSIPIGLENDFWLKDKKAKMVRKLQQHRNYKALVYVNHNVRTNPERQKPYDILRGKSWATINNGSNGQGFDNYLDNIFNHPFVVCPAGNGIDTHRTWECLYMKTIPIEKRNINNQFYTDLPILFVDDWEEITQRLLHDTFMRFTDMKWNLEKLTFEYWENEIKHSAAGL